MPGAAHEANFDWQANKANLRGKAWKRTSQVNIWANIIKGTHQMKCLLIEHIMKIMMLTGASNIDMYADGGDISWRDPNQNSQQVDNTLP